MKPLIRYGVLGLDGNVLYWTLTKPASSHYIKERIFIIRKKP